MNMHKPINPRSTVLATLLGLAAALLSACAALPQAQQPAAAAPPALPARFGLDAALDAALGGAAELAPAAPAPQGWAALGEPALAAWVAQGLAANLDLRQAAERVQRSRALAAGSDAALWPAGGLAMGVRRAQLGAQEAPGLDAAARRSTRAQAGAELSWELDLFGRLRSQAAAAQARLQLAEADAEALRLAVATELAQTWFTLAGVREQQQLARGVLESRRATLALVQGRQRAGYSAALDEARARAELAAAEAELPALLAAERQVVHRMAVLVGAAPAGFEPPALPAAAPSAVRLAVPTPTQWLHSRPDLRAAEAAMAAQALDVQAIRAELLPRLSLQGVLGFVAGSAAGLGAAGSASWWVSPSLTLPVFDRARIQARLQAAQAQQREAILAYQQRVLLALEEVETALVQVQQGQRQLQALQERVQQALRAEALARRRFELGASDLLELLDAQRGAQQAQFGLAGALTAQRLQAVGLWRALGQAPERAPG